MKNKNYCKSMITIYILVISGMISVALLMTKSVTAMVENTPVHNRTTIVIDAGHGGIDGGATSKTGVLESKTNLQIALRLRDLCHLLGMKTLMIRTEDISVYTSGDTISAQKISDLKERVRIVNECEDCLLISIHQNYFSDGKYSGAQIFYNKNARSEELANTMQTSLIQTLNPGSKRKAKQADGIYLMQKIRTTGLLIECGFISNINEDQLLQTKEYQQKLCMVISSVLSIYLNT